MINLQNFHKNKENKRQKSSKKRNYKYEFIKIYT